MEGKRVAVVTDALSADFYFPVWHKYYAANFGAENIYVCTYRNRRSLFDGYALGGVWQAASYDNRKRVLDISSLVRHLLQSYHYVIRVDTDEMLVADPREFASLADYMEKLDRPYVTACGYDIVPLASDPPLDLGRPIIGAQRSLAYAYDALAKTAVTGIPLTWAPGFHFSTVFPEFNRLYLLHLKRADIDMQIEISRFLVDSAAEGGVRRDYYLSPREAVVNHIRSALTHERGEGWDFFLRRDYWRQFLAGVRYSVGLGGIYQGRDFAPDKAVVTLPPEFAGRF